MLYSEIKHLVKLALPVSLAQMSVMGMTATDVLIAGQASTVDLAGMNLGSNAWNMVILFFMGIGFATQPLVANQFGARSDQGIKHQFQQSFWMSFGLGLIATVCILCAAWLISFASFETDMRVIAQQFLLVISAAALPMSVIPAVRGTLEGVGLTASVFWVNFSAFLLNIPLDLAFVHGLWGFPQLGGVGCAWATVILVWGMCLSFCAVAKWHQFTKDKQFFSDFMRPHWQTIRRTLNLGLPIGLSIVIELSMFSGAGIVIASLGAIQAGAHAVAITIVALSFMLYMGLGQGVTIRASQFLGASNIDAARYTIKVGTVFNVAVSLFFCVLFVIFTHEIVGLMIDDTEVIAVAVVLLTIGAIFQVSDCLQIALICALRAYHDTASPPKYQVFSFWVLSLPIGIGLAFYQWWPGFEGAKGMWIAMLIGLTTVCGLLLKRLRDLMVNNQASSVINQVE